MKTRFVLVIGGVIGLVYLSKAFSVADLWARKELLIDEPEVITEGGGLGEPNVINPGEAFHVEAGHQLLTNDPQKEASLLQVLQSNGQKLRNIPVEEDHSVPDDSDSEYDEEEDGDNPSDDLPEEYSEEDESDNYEDRKMG